MPLKERIKQSTVFLLAGGFRWLHRNRHRFARIVRRCFAPVFAVGRFLARFILPHPYRLIMGARRMLRAAGFTAHNRAATLLSPRMLVHGTVIVILLAVGASNVYAHTTEQVPVGEKSTLFSLIGGEGGGDEEFVGVPSPPPVPAYWDPDAVTPAGTGDIDDITAEDDTELNQPALAGGAVLQPTLPSGAPSVAPRTAPEFYIVRAGDTVAGIARQFSISESTIFWENNLTARAALRPGDRITILPGNGVGYTVRRGDTVVSIAQQHRTAPEKIIAWIPGGALRVGEKIFIPDGSPPAPPRAAPLARVIPRPGPSSSPGSGAMVWPTAWRIITQYFHWRHTGVDIDGDYTTPIYAADSGVVKHAGWGRTHGGYGFYMDIDHGEGITTRYGHASKIFVQVGDAVNRGQAIGMVGTTGRSTGTHLHFEVRINGVPVNPLGFIR